MKKKPLVILTGPTAVGKTETSLWLAKHIGGEIISADSMQVYRGMDIGSAKIMPDEMQGIPHHLIDVLDPDEEFNVVRFQEMANITLDDYKNALATDRSIIIIGKGNKERLVYFDARTKIHLQNYLCSRTDSNPALFVTLRAPFERLQIGGVEMRLRQLGKRLSIPKVHPHKFRRTLATSAIDKGMPIEQVQQLLGHQKIDTTMHYAMVKQQNVKLAHRKYIG